MWRQDTVEVGVDAHYIRRSRNGPLSERAFAVAGMDANLHAGCSQASLPQNHSMFEWMCRSMSHFESHNNEDPQSLSHFTARGIGCRSRFSDPLALRPCHCEHGEVGVPQDLLGDTSNYPLTTFIWTSLATSLRMFWTTLALIQRGTCAIGTIPNSPRGQPSFLGRHGVLLGVRHEMLRYVSRLSDVLQMNTLETTSAHGWSQHPVCATPWCDDSSH